MANFYSLKNVTLHPINLYFVNINLINLNKSNLNIIEMYETEMKQIDRVYLPNLEFGLHPALMKGSWTLTVLTGLFVL